MVGADEPGVEDELVEVRDGGPTLLDGAEGRLIVDILKTRRRLPWISRPNVQRPRMTPQISMGLI